MPDLNPTSDTARYFALFNEVGIINQLSTAMFEARLPRGFVVAQFAVLNHLIRVKDGRTPLELARAFQVPKTSMTHSLAVLERAGLIHLTANPGDGRSKQVWITEAGRAFRDDAIAGMAADSARLADAVPSDEIAEILPLLSRLRAVMDRMRDDPAP
jgi:DNA-binding MarR family transcriptional regulator